MQTCPYCLSPVAEKISVCSSCGGTLGTAAAYNTAAQAAGGPQDHLPSGLVLQVDQTTRIVLGKVLGRGGFGITYEGVQNPGTPQQRPVAVKECFPDGLVRRDQNGHVHPLKHKKRKLNKALKEFAEETQLLQRIQHPVATECLGMFYANNTAYIVMEFIQGETLEARIQRGPLLSETEAINIMLPILDLLEKLHDQQLLHRDIKPANIMLATQRIELIDYGSSTAFETTKRTQVTSKILTPAYAPLELYGSHVQLGPSSDLYSLAATMYEAITNQRVPSAIDRANGAPLPHIAVGSPLASSFKNWSGSNPATLVGGGQVSKHFADVLHKALEQKITDRYASANDMLQALQGSSTPKQQQANPAPAQKRKPSKRRTPKKRPKPKLAKWQMAALLLLAFFVVRHFWNQHNQRLSTEQQQQQFLKDQCGIQGRVSTLFRCEILKKTTSHLETQIVLSLAANTTNSLTFPKVPLNEIVQREEFQDFAQELARNAMLVLNTEIVQIEVITNTNLSIFSEVYTKKMFAGRSSQSMLPQNPKVRQTNKQRAALRTTLESSQLFVQAFTEQETLKLKNATGVNLDLGETYFTPPNNGSLGVYIEAPGTADEVLKLADNKKFRLALRDMLLNTRVAMSGIDLVSVSLRTNDQYPKDIWGVVTSETYGSNDAIAKASNTQLEDIWRLTFSEHWYGNHAVAWTLPLQVMKQKPCVLGVLLVNNDAARLSSPIPAESIQAELHLDKNDSRVPSRSINFDTGVKLLRSCLVNPNQDMNINYNTTNGDKGQVVAKRAVQATPNQNVDVVRLRLDKSKKNVEIVSNQFGYLSKTQILEIVSNNQEPHLEITKDKVLIPWFYTKIVPRNLFQKSSVLRLTALSFDQKRLLSYGLSISRDQEFAQPSDLEASSIETTPVPMQQLQQLRNDEWLEFDQTLTWKVQR